MTRHDATESFTDAVHRVLAERGAESATPLSAEQRRLWLLSGIAGGSWAVVSGRYRLNDAPDTARLRLRLASLASRHEALRSVFVDVAGRPVRLLLPFAELPLRTVAGLESTHSSRTEDLARHLVEEEFSLGQGPLLRALLLTSADGSSAELVLAGHRLVLDETSLDLLVAELLGDTAEAARAAAPGTGSQSLEEALEAEGARLADPGLTGRVADWGTELARPAATEVRPFGTRPPIKENATASVVVPLPADLVAPAAAAPDWEAAVAAAWLVVLMRSQATGAAVCGVRTTRSARPGQVAGPLDTLRPIRVDDASDLPLPALLAAVGRLLRQPPVDVPFAHLLEAAPPRRDISRTPYLQTVVRAVDSRLPLGGGAGTGRPVPTGISATEYDLDVTVRQEPGVVTAQIDYDIRLYTEDRVRGLASQLAAVLGTLLSGDSADATAATVSLLGDGGAQLAVAAGRGEQTAIPAAETPSLVDLVAAQAAARPDAVALRQGGNELTYAQLWSQALGLADELAARGVRPGDRVAVWLRRGSSTIISLLGVLAAGAAFVPVDASYPEERVRYLLSDSRPTMVITDSSVYLFGGLGVPTLLLDELAGVPASDGPRRPERVPADAPAYLIYTSGTTGRPKGVVVRHLSVVNNIGWRQANWQLTGEDRVLHNHSFSFDPSVWAVFWPLATGASIVLADEEEMRDPARMIATLRDRQVTVLGGVPSLVSLLLDHRDAGACTRIRLVLSGAEPLTDTLLARIESTWAADIANLYGPTEATIDATAHQVPRGDRTIPVPIGRAVHNAGVHIVDADLRPVPDGVPGEIVVTGAGVADGYHDRPALTAARFLPDPFDGEGGRLYRTGDLGRRLPDGSVQFLGRVDDQVKIRGHRVELGEVEAALRTVPGVKDAAVVALDAGTETARLAAALVPADAAQVPTPDGIRAALADALPDYLLPDWFTVVGELPRTPNGKADRRAVAALLAERADASAPGSDGLTEPRNALERSVGEAFASVLRVPAVDIHADFFGLGGTSVILARLATLLGNRHDIEIPLHEFFRTPTVAGVAETIEVYRREGLAGVLGRKHAATLEGDGTLDPSISPEGLPEADWENPRRVFLTGATGYLGLHLIEQLLRRTDAEVVCLCRARDEEHALERLKEGFDLYEIDVADQIHRVRAIVGDLAEPRLGLTQEQWDELAATTDVIYHNGALVNFVYPYSALKAANVGGTQRVLELACTTRLKAVHHVSTIDTLLATHMPRPFLENDAPLQSAVGVPAGYTGSKWVAEKVVDEARRRGIPVTVFRPGLILGHTKNGATQTIDYLLVALRGFLPMRVLPDYPRIFDVVPVDYVASAIVHISGKREAIDGFYHLFNPEPVPLLTFCEWIKGYGYEFDIVPFEEGRRRALSVGPGHLLYPLVPLIKDAEAEPHRALDPKHIDEVQPALECAETLRMLAGSDIACPPTTEPDAHAVMDYLVRTGFMPAPADVQHDDPVGSAVAR
ncbi:amino acid adenylation domain-containing protein [Streptomyces sp. NPDC048272]|uniref:amino acid adenylation domain-containing protein n=1 Tax=Streptomyces sp. NPDC048272 TaxID=3154616 RepID=UPI0034491556